MDEEVNYKVTLPAIVDSTFDASHSVEIKKEFYLREPHSQGGFGEHAVVKNEDASTQLLDLQIKSEVYDLKCDIKSDNDAIFIKLEPLVTEEQHIKNDVEGSLIDKIIKRSQVNHFCCGLCDSKFASKRNLQEHLNIHTGEKPFQCNMCDHKCIAKSNLRLHMKRHTGEKPFQCNLCDYKSVEKSKLRLHMKIHTGERPFQCNVCHYKSIQKSTLRRHMKTHTGEKPFQCNACDYKCIQKSTLRRHMKTHTGEKLLNRSICNYRHLKKSDL